jgi:PAS domain S-box-containing protein
MPDVSHFREELLTAKGLNSAVADIEVAQRSLRKVLLEHEQALKDLADQKFALDQHAIVAVTDVQGTITYVNDKFCTISQYSKEELIGQNHRIGNSGHHAREFFEEMFHTIANGKVWHGEIKNRAKSGSFYWVDTTVVPLLDAGGKPRQYMAIRTDITERKRTDEMRERLAAVVESSDDAIISKTMDGTISGWNRGAERMFGYTASEMVGKSMLILMPDRTDEESDFLTRIKRGERVDHFETVRVRKDGQKINVSVTISPIKLSGAIIGASAIARNITERKKGEEKLAETLKELKRSNQELQLFAYVSSHDLQEPLRMVASYTQLLAKRYKGRLGSDADEFIAFAIDGCNRMQGLIQDLLAYSRVGTKEKVLQEVSGDEALQEALTNLRKLIEQSGAVVTHDSLPAITADDTQLVQVFQNLVGNAIKYRSAEVPRVHVSASKNGGNEWIFSVRDNGIGIDPQYFERIFILFQRLHGRGEFEGNGIGLAVCKKIVERMGGRIWVESQFGHGSTFYFALPEGNNK